jgi:hypothetical protein
VFCDTVLGKQERDVNLLLNIAFSDDATFHFNDSVNTHNQFIYATSAHFSNAVRDALNAEVPNHWIGQAGPIPWPPRSSVLCLLYF